MTKRTDLTGIAICKWSARAWLVAVAACLPVSALAQAPKAEQMSDDERHLAEEWQKINGAATGDTIGFESLMRFKGMVERRLGIRVDDRWLATLFDQCRNSPRSNRALLARVGEKPHSGDARDNWPDSKTSIESSTPRMPGTRPPRSDLPVYVDEADGVTTIRQVHLSRPNYNTVEQAQLIGDKLFVVLDHGWDDMQYDVICLDSRDAREQWRQTINLPQPQVMYAGPPGLQRRRCRVSVSSGRIVVHTSGDFLSLLHVFDARGNCELGLLFVDQELLDRRPR